MTDQRFLRVDPAGLEPSGDALPTLAGTHLFGGLLRHQFGHLLKQSSGRLWSLGVWPRADSVLFFVEDQWRHYLSRGADPLNAGWMKTLFASLGFREVHIILKPTRVENLLVPANDGYWFGINGRHPLYDEVALPRLLDAAGGATGEDRLYVSRRAFTDGKEGTGGILLEGVIERNLLRDGYAVIHPETLDLTRQIALYASARRIVCPDISALHLLALVGRPGQEVCIVNRRTNPAYHRHFVDQLSCLGLSVSVADHIDRVETRELRGGRKVDMTVLDLDRLGTSLREAGFLGETRWLSPSGSDIEAEVRRFQAG